MLACCYLTGRIRPVALQMTALSATIDPMRFQYRSWAACSLHHYDLPTEQ